MNIMKNKRRIGLVLISLFLLNVNVFAKKIEKRNIFGVYTGGVYSSISDYEGKAKVGFIGGLYWEFRISEKISLMSNLLYSQRGENGKGDLSNVKLGYFNMPLTIKYNLSDKLGISTGINSDLLLSVDGDGVNKDDFKKSDWAIPVGISYDIDNNLQLGIIYNIGLSNITKSNIIDGDLKNNWGSISLSYLFK
jgi:hypothetical protein